MSEYSVEEVRALAKYLKEGTPNWYRESFGDFKSSVHTCDNAPKNAVAMLTAYADLREQIKRSREGVKEYIVSRAENARVFVLNDRRKYPHIGSQELNHIAMRSALLAIAHLLPSGEPPPRPPIIVPPYVSADDANRLYGDQFGVDWKYEAITADTFRKLHPPAQAAQVACTHKWMA